MNPRCLLTLGHGLDQHRSGAVAEQNARSPVSVVDDAAHGIGADHQDLLVGSGGHQVGAHGGTVDEAGAGRDEVETPGAARADAVLHQAGSRRKHEIGSDGANDDRVHLGRLHTAMRQRALSGCDGHVGGRHILGGNVSFPDAGALENPLVIGIHHFLEVAVGQKSGRGIAPQCGDFRLWQIGLSFKDSE